MYFVLPHTLQVTPSPLSQFNSTIPPSKRSTFISRQTYLNMASLPPKPSAVPDSFSKSDSIAFPFPISESASSIDGPTYVAPQALVELSTYALSDAIFTYSPETFDLDTSILKWKNAQQDNGFGVVPLLSQLDTRAGAGSLPLGYILSSGLERKFKPAPRSIIASSGSIPSLTPVLNEISYLPALPAPIVLNVAAIDYSPVTGTYVPDYVTAFNAARDTGLALVTSSKASELQHMTLLSSLLSSSMPTLHLYDGLRIARENQKIADVLGVKRFKDLFVDILSAQDKTFHRNDPVSKVNRLLSSLNLELGTSYRLFEYEGHDQPDVVFVILGSTDSSIAAEVALSLSDAGERVGILTVRVPAPFGESQFLNALPRSTKQVYVFGQVYSQDEVDDLSFKSSLFTDIFAAVVMSPDFPADRRPKLVDLKYTRENSLFTPKHFVWYFEQIARGSSKIELEIPADVHANAFSAVTTFDLLAEQDAAQFIIWDADDSPFVQAPSKLAQLFSLDTIRNVEFLATFDNTTLSGVVQSEIRSCKRAIDSSFGITNANVVAVLDDKILSAYNAVDSLKNGGILLINSSSKFEEFVEKIPFTVKESLVAKEIAVVTVNLAELADPADLVLSSLVAQLALLRVTSPNESIEDYLGRVVSLNSGYTELTATAVSALSEKIDSALTKAEVSKTWELKDDNEPVVLPGFAIADSFTTNKEKFIEEPTSSTASWQIAAKTIAFKEAFDYKSELRPDLPVKNFIAKVKELKRLTPLSYDRNIFHIEFDISGTGLKYEIGEALGIHGQNDKGLVEKFIKEYGLNGEEIVLIPARELPNEFEQRTIFQVLLENLDIFGKTPKKFYESLAEFATDEKQKARLSKLASPEGAEEFKKLTDEETLTYADVLIEFDSARPSFEDLIKIVNPLKRREYSIASSQKVHPNEVHLLIVVVDWVDSKGRKRFGQCSRYISQLSLGSEVVVSVKPSVMKLPPLTTQPIIMSGLGTGLAPFKAFVEEKAWQKAQGNEIGDVFLYLGSRHQKEEYLYGEFWEANMAAGIVTHIGAAFSRDQPEKIYIQDRMRQSIDALVPAFVEKTGVFYLCGPTWPVPDVTAVLEDVIAKDAETRGEKVDTAKEVEELKEKNRYILEVY
ncbi:uncharacterized protein V1516DRAFT_681303 [Lipomyces oligophaga]|uniref:uncharacterized protein n=1 Tax=Lipomyces oligophaga TaxID=45792 RepID=UPI0034CF0212